MKIFYLIILLAISLNLFASYKIPLDSTDLSKEHMCNLEVEKSLSFFIGRIGPTTIRLKLALVNKAYVIKLYDDGKSIMILYRPFEKSFVDDLLQDYLGIGEYLDGQDRDDQLHNYLELISYCWEALNSFDQQRYRTLYNHMKWNIFTSCNIN